VKQSAAANEPALPISRAGSGMPMVALPSVRKRLSMSTVSTVFEVRAEHRRHRLGLFGGCRAISSAQGARAGLIELRGRWHGAVSNWITPLLL
jgi:hypothetical protein